MGHTRRTTEGVLLLFASLILTLGFALVFAAKIPVLRHPGRANINTASEHEIAAALGVDRSIARRICEYRAEHRAFRDVDSLSDVPVLTDGQAMKLSGIEGLETMSAGEMAARTGISTGQAARIVERLASRNSDGRATTSLLSRIPAVSSETISRHEEALRTRDPGEAVLSFWLYAGLLIASFLVLHGVLRKRAPQGDPFLLPCIMVLAGLGAMSLFSIKDPLRDTNVFAWQIQGVLLGTAIAIVPLSGWLRALRPWRYTYLYVIVSVVLTSLLALFGTGPGGAHLSLLGMQPIELIKIALVFFVASYLSDRWSLLTDRTGPRRRFQLPLFRDIGPLVLMYLLSLATFVLVKDLGPMLVLFGMFVALLYVATGSIAFVLVGLGLVGVSGWLAYILKLGVFDVRVDMWLHPWQNQHANGMHLAQSLWAFGTGGTWGSGLGLGRPDTMPRAGSDLIFASIGEELGLIGSLAVLAIYGILISRCLRAAMRAGSDFDRFLAAGIGALLGIQTIVIVFGVVGLLPLTGITLPFVSFGRSSMIASFFALGLIMRISADSRRGGADIPAATRTALRRLALGMVVLLLGVAGIGRIMWIQGVQADRIAGMTATVPDADQIARPHINPRLKAIEADIPRGSIYDRNGRVLASSRDSELQELDVADFADSRPGGRYYPYGETLVNITGYLDPRCGGPIGFEKRLDNELRGFDDYSALLPIYRLSHTPYCPKLVGKDVRLTIDAELQKAVERALSKYTNALRDRRTGLPKNKGAAVVLDVYTGEVLAAVSIPSYDPNTLAFADWRVHMQDGGSDHVLVDRALNGIYPPGSTFKIVTAAAALQNGVDFTHTCRHRETGVRWQWGGKYYSRRRITDLEDMSSHGATNLAKAVRVSCNLYFAHLAMELGPEKMYDMAGKRFGLKYIPPPKRLAEDLPDSGYGQGRILVTPLEMARVVAAIANNGIMMAPQFVREVREKDEVLKTFEPSEMGRPLDPEVAAELRKMMLDVTTRGTAHGLFDGLDVKVAGKTGSAENDQGDGLAHSWFVGFAPADDPRVAFAVVIENGGFGRRSAGPVCREIVKAAL